MSPTGDYKIPPDLGSNWAICKDIVSVNDYVDKGKIKQEYEDDFNTEQVAFDVSINGLRHSIRSLIRIFKLWLKFEEDFWSKCDDIKESTFQQKQTAINNTRINLETLKVSIENHEILDLTQDYTWVIKQLENYMLKLSKTIEMSDENEVVSDGHKKISKPFQFLDV